MGKKYTTHTISIGDHNLDAPVMVQINALIADGLHSEAGYLTEESGTTRLTDAEIAAMGYIKTYTDTDTNTQLSDAQIAEMGYIKTYTDTNTQLTSAQIAAMGYTSNTGTLTSSNDRNYITDTRGSQRAPSYYNDRYAQWDFQNAADTTVGGDGWHALLTVSKWSNWHSSHRQEQLIFSGDHLWRRTATSDTVWGTNKKIWDSGNLTNNSANWNEAHGWGNHADEGYLTSYTDTDTNTQLSQAQVGAYAVDEGFIKEYTDTDTQLTSAEIAEMGYTGDQTAAQIQALGMARFYNNAVLNSSTTTATFIAELISDYGCFANNQVTLKVQWSYAGSSNLVTDHATIGTIELAGCTIETWGGSYKHVRISRPNTGTGGHMVVEYNDQHSGYAPGWREIWTSESDGAGSGLDADLLDGQQGSHYLDYANFTGTVPTWNQDTTGNATTATTATLASKVSINSDFSGTYPMLVEVESSGTIYNNPSITYNGTSDTLTSPNFAGALTGNATTATTAANSLLLNGLTNSASGGSNKILASHATNGYLYINNWIHPANGTGLFYDAGVHFHETGNYMYSNTSLQAANDMRAPLFYDRNDTNYYIDPASTSTALNVKGAIKVLSSHSGGNIELDYPYSGNTTYAGNMVMFMSEPGVTHDGGGIGNNIATNSPYYGRKYNHGYGVYLRFYKTNGHFEFWNTQGNAGTAGGQGTRRFHGDASGNTFSQTSSRAPIFYDTNNTSYYVDAGSTTQLNHLSVNSTFKSRNFAAGSLGYQLENRNAGGATFRFDGDTFIFYGGGGVGNVFEMNQNGDSTARTSLRAPIFYDSNDTNYYGNFAGVSRINQAQLTYLGVGTAANTSGGYRINMGGSIDMNNNSIDYVTQLHFQDNVRFLDDGNDSYLNFKYGDSTTGGIRIKNGSNVQKGYLYADSSGFGLLDNDGQWAVRTQTGSNPLELRCNNNVEFQVYTSYTTSPGSSRAPIFYDSNNTGYYLNPASTSNLNALTLAGTATASNFILSSDERKKTKIKDLPRNNINTNWKSFEMKNDEGEYRTGVIAQELEETHPEFVNTDPEGFKSVKYIDLLIAKIAELEARLEKLEK